VTRKDVVPVKELKRQIDEKNRQEAGSIYVNFLDKVKASWNMCPCDSKAVKTKPCHGRIFIQFKNDIGRPLTYQIELIADCKKQSTYIIMDAQFDELIENGGFSDCSTERIEY